MTGRFRESFSEVKVELGQSDSKPKDQEDLLSNYSYAAELRERRDTFLSRR